MVAILPEISYNDRVYDTIFFVPMKQLIRKIEMKLLSVTVPSYNSQDYLENCIESLLPGGERIEIIIINDGSKDRTGEIADSYAAKYPTIVKAVHQENGGHGEGINQGLRHATGTYFKVVDSDDRLSTDLNDFLDHLESLEAQGGADLVVTNYFYVHTDGIGDRSINYSNVLKEGLHTWSDTKTFQIHQMLTIHSCTFRTETMRAHFQDLPKHTFYEDNLMVCQNLPHVEKLSYFNRDLYLYTMGREGQSVQRNTMCKRYAHQVLSTVLCFKSFHFDDIANRRLKRYLKHELFMMFGISILYTRMNKTKEADADMKKMWADCIAHDAKYGKHFRYRTPLLFLCIPGKFGQAFCNLIYSLAMKVVRYN